MLILTTTHIIDESEGCNTHILITLSLGVHSNRNRKANSESSLRSSKTSEFEEGLKYELHDGTVKVRTVPSLCWGDN
jgi:hypothetical protein